MRIVLIVFLGLSGLLAGCSSKPSLTADEQAVWDNYINKHQSRGTVRPSSKEADRVAELGNKIVPYIEDNLGKAYTSVGKKGDYWLVIPLARIGTEKAKEVIVKVLHHDYPGKLEHDREVAAKALVWLGATEYTADMEAVVEDMERRFDKELAKDKADGLTGQKLEYKKFDYQRRLEIFRDSLAKLKSGKGKRDTTDFPFGRRG
jgi:hypothetical protein